MKKKLGFTMAETLVTLAIIGVIASILFPALKDTKPNNEMAMFKKAYYNTTRIISELINDEDFYPERDTEAESGFSNVSISDQICGQDNNTTRECQASYHGYVFQGNSKFCGLFASKINTTVSGDPNDYCAQQISLDNNGNFQTPDGVSWSMPVGNFSSDNGETIYVDINGKDRGTNCINTGANTYSGSVCAQGVAPDRFAINVRRNGTVEIPSAIGRAYVSSSKINKTYIQFVKEDEEVKGEEVKK